MSTCTLIKQPLLSVRSEGIDMRSPNIGLGIGPGVFIGRPEGQIVGGIEHYCAVITYAKANVEKPEARSGGLGGPACANPHGQVLGA